ncbi:MAG: nucleoside deaminase [Alphaproteobacteria bacterium]
MKPDLPTRMMQLALSEARAAAVEGEVPVGAVVYKADGTVLARAHNRVEATRTPTAHAEFVAALEALKVGDDMYLTDCTVAVTLEPCAMCAAALAALRVKAIYFGAYDPKSGGTEHGAQVLKHSHHKPHVVGGLLEVECAEVLKAFFKDKRD